MNTTFSLLTSSQSNEWYSPTEIIAPSRYVLGGIIDLDPASSAEANRTVQAVTYYTKEDDGLLMPWFGNVFLNPPYGIKKKGNHGASAWLERAQAAYEAMEINSAVIVCRGDSRGVRDLTERAVWCDIGRVTFTNPDKPESQRAVPGTRIFYLGEDTVKFYQAFHKLGTIVKPFAP